MEEIIVFMIAICLSALFDYFKSSIKKEADSSRANRNTQLSNNQRLANLMSQFKESDTEFKSTFTSHRFHFNFNHENDKIVEPTSIASEPSPNQPTNSSIKASQPQSKQIATTTIETADSNRKAIEHYERWRQAIIYAEIITPKFKTE